MLLASDAESVVLSDVIPLLKFRACEKPDEVMRFTGLVALLKLVVGDCAKLVVGDGAKLVVGDRAKLVVGDFAAPKAATTCGGHGPTLLV